MLKRLLFGAIPYYFTKLFSPRSESLHYYQYIMQRGYARHLFDFRHEYKDMSVELQYDKEKGLHYITSAGRRLYFKKDMELKKIVGLYKELVIEQDIRSPHHYFNNIEEELKGKILLDIGGAEGLIALRAIESIDHAYIFECNPSWIEALNATFEPWKDKVTIVNKLIGAKTEGEQLALDDFFEDKSYDNLFLKMDIEGAELHALQGAGKILSTGKNIGFAVCTYHEEDNGKSICALLDNFKCTYSHQYGFFRKKIRSVVVRGNNLRD